MKKILFLTFFASICLAPHYVMANEAEALAFFERFVTTSNEWSLEPINMYDKTAIIKRRVLKKNPVTVIVPLSEQEKILKTYNKNKKFLSGVKNNYKNIQIASLGNDKYKITALRCPSILDTCFDSYIIIQKKSNEYKIIEEYSDVKSSYFLKYRDRK